MIHSTTPDIKGKNVDRYCGVVSSEVILGVNTI